MALGLAALALAPAAARADVITFSGPRAILTPGHPSAEGAFAYDVLGGELFRSDIRGNPSPDIEGVPAFSGGILDVVRNDVPGGLFTFQSSQIAEFSFRPSRPILFPVFFAGYRNGVLQGTDTFTPLTQDGTFTTVLPAHLSGVALDELCVTLQADIGDFGRWIAADNLTLAPQAPPVPEPSTLTLLALGTLALAGWRRRRGRKQAA
jgi:hypothetical protein